MRLQKFGCKALNRSSKVMMPVIATAARPCAAFYSVERVGGSVGPPSRSAPDGVRTSQKKKNERVARNARRPIVSNFKVSGQPMTSEVTRSGPSDTTIFGILWSRPEWANRCQITFYHFINPRKSISGENSVILDHLRSVTSIPRMTFDELDIHECKI